MAAYELACPSTYELIDTPAKLDDVCARAAKKKWIAFDTETSSIDSMSCKLRGFSIAFLDDGQIVGYYVPYNKGLLSDAEGAYVAVDDLLCDDDVAKVFHNAPYDLVVLTRYDFTVRNVHDTQMMSYALDGQKYPGRGHGMDALAKFHFGYETIQFNDVVIPELGIKEFGDVPLLNATAYAAEDVAVTALMFIYLKRQLKKKGLWELYSEVDRPLLQPLAGMKIAGVRVNTERLVELGVEWRKIMDDAQDQVFDLVGEVNLGSPKQVGELLFEKLKLPSPITTDTGAPSTGAKALELLENQHPVVKLIKTHRTHQKLLSSFIDAWPEHITDQEKIHGNINPCVTVTGRFSGSSPNMQQVPSRSEQGQEIRRAVVAGPGNKLVVCDYSQIELRVLAHITEDPSLVQAFHDGVDIHASTAARINGGKPEDYLNKEDKDKSFLRTASKTINFGIVYGMGPMALSMALNISMDEAQDFIDSYFEQMPSVQDWMEATRDEARKNLYSETLFGRRIHTPYIRSRDRGRAGHDERLACNGVIQGTAADLMRLGISKTAEKIEAYDASLLLTVHDELLVETKTSSASQVADAVGQAMRTAADDWIDWKVPILADADIGDSWAEGKK